MNFYTTILGNGAAIPTLTQHCSGQAVNVNGCRILLDCGEGIQSQMRRYHQKIQSLHIVCISHLHGDHFFGLPGLLATLHLLGRRHPLTVVGPQGIREGLLAMISISGTQIDYELQVIELAHSDCRQVAQHPRCRIMAFPLAHSVPTYGYILEEIPRSQSRPRRMAYCTDTGLFDGLAQSVSGVDMLCLESTFADDMTAVAMEKQHLTASQAATVAAEANVGQLLLTHFSARYNDQSIFLDQARPLFANTRLAVEGDQVPIGYDATTSIPSV